MKFWILFLIPVVLLSQTNSGEEALNHAFVNAKKGYYYALANIPEKKSNLNTELIDQDNLICKISLEKVTNGVKVQSTGFYESCEIKITAYKSMDKLIEEGYIKPAQPDSTEAKSNSKTQRKKKN